MIKVGDKVIYYGKHLWGRDNIHTARVIAIFPQSNSRLPLIHLSFVMESNATGKKEELFVQYVPPAADPRNPTHGSYVIPQKKNKVTEIMEVSK